MAFSSLFGEFPLSENGSGIQGSEAQFLFYGERMLQTRAEEAKMLGGQTGPERMTPDKTPAVRDLWIYWDI
jgi:hypothetical protein